MLARLSALSYKAKNEAITVLEDFSFETPKTKELVNIRKNLQLANKKSLLILPEENNNIYLSSRNLQGTKVVTIYDLNTYDIMSASRIVFFESTLGLLQTNE